MRFYFTVLCSPRNALSQTTWTVNSDYLLETGVLEDDAERNNDGQPGDGVCDTGSEFKGFTGICTLQAAIDEANERDTILFASGLTIVHIIADSETANTISQGSLFIQTLGITINGQTGTSGRIIIDGSLLGFEFNGDTHCITVRVPRVTLKNIEVNNCTGFGIRIIGDREEFEPMVEETVIQSNNIHDNGGGIHIEYSSNNQIGGLTDTPGSGLGNIFSNSATSPGVLLTADVQSVESCADNIFEGNLIGIDLNGPAGNAIAGFSIGGHPTLPCSDGFRIGGPDPMQRNVISANGGSGIVLSGPGATIQGNCPARCRLRRSAVRIRSFWRVASLSSIGTLETGVTAVQFMAANGTT